MNKKMMVLLLILLSFRGIWNCVTREQKEDKTVWKYENCASNEAIIISKAEYWDDKLILYMTGEDLEDMDLVDCMDRANNSIESDWAYYYSNGKYIIEGENIHRISSVTLGNNDKKQYMIHDIDSKRYDISTEYAII